MARTGAASARTHQCVGPARRIGYWELMAAEVL
jgi:hypothetical protein